MTVTVALRNVSKRFTVGEEVIIAVDDVTFTVGAGEVACVYGASGSGKTTLLNILAGIDTPDTGEVTVAGAGLHGRSEPVRADIRLHRIGVVFQANNLLPEFSAQENVVLPLLVRGMDRAEAGRRAEAALRSVGLPAVGSRLPARMSGGQRQRVGIARALAGQQQVLLADEPTGALDSGNSRALFALLREQCDQRGTSVVIATHDPLAQDYSDAVYDMVDGVVGAR